MRSENDGVVSHGSKDDHVGVPAISCQLTAHKQAVNLKGVAYAKCSHSVQALQSRHSREWLRKRRGCLITLQVTLRCQILHQDRA